MPDVSIVIVNYNVCEFLDQALSSLSRATCGLDTEIFVVDNNSADGSVEMVRSRYPDVEIIENEDNVGFGKANNMALRRTHGRHVLILNPDTIVREDTLEKLVAFMDEHPDAGAVGCQILNPDGSFARESRRSFPTPGVAFFRMTGLSSLFPRSRVFGRYNMTFLPKDETAEVDALSGSCMMLRRRALLDADENGPENADVGRRMDGLDRTALDAPAAVETDRKAAGLFDEAFFMYGEDLDLCYRIQKAGWKIYYFPETQIIHYKGESTKKGELRYVRLFYGAMLLFTEKHLDPGRSRFLRLGLRCGIVGRAALSLFKSSLSSLWTPLLDGALVYVIVAAIGLLRWLWVGSSINTLFFGTIAPLYAVATMVGIWLAGGYRRAHRLPFRPVLLGTTAGFFAVASLSFFFPVIAFSRIVVATAYPTSALILSLRRAIGNAHRVGMRRAVLVGEPGDAERLSRMLSVHPRPPFILEGVVTAGESGAETRQGGVPVVGRLSSLRDLVRLRDLHDIVFSARSFSNQFIFQTMRELQDLTVEFRMLHDESEQVIGKDSVSRLSMNTTLADLPEVVKVRTRLSRRRFEIMLAISALVLAPISPVLLPLAGLPVRRTLSCLKWIPAVLAGRRSVVGCAEGHESLVPTAWRLPKGVFSITNTIETRELDTDDIVRAYWFYVTHQSPGLDADIMIRSLRGREATG